MMTDQPGFTPESRSTVEPIDLEGLSGGLLCAAIFCRQKGLVNSEKACQEAAAALDVAAELVADVQRAYDELHSVSERSHDLTALAAKRVLAAALRRFKTERSTDE
jgi:hypothetical protein